MVAYFQFNLLAYCRYPGSIRIVLTILISGGDCISRLGCAFLCYGILAHGQFFKSDCLIRIDIIPCLCIR